MMNTDRLDRLEREADEACRTFGVESREYSAALVKVGREEARLQRAAGYDAQADMAARYVNTYRPY